MYKATVHFETVVEAKAFVTASNEVDFKVAWGACEPVGDIA